MKPALVVLVFTLCAAACAQEKAAALAPWLQSKIAEYESLPRSNPPRSIHQSKFAGKTVYYVPPVCCDIPSDLYDEAGTLVCHPGGGFAGSGDGKCPLFSASEAMSSTLWRDVRKRVDRSGGASEPAR
jgi:hypothetical protein